MCSGRQGTASVCIGYPPSATEAEKKGTQAVVPHLHPPLPGSLGHGGESPAWSPSHLLPTSLPRWFSHPDLHSSRALSLMDGQLLGHRPVCRHASPVERHAVLTDTCSVIAEPSLPLPSVPYSAHAPHTSAASPPLIPLLSLLLLLLPQNLSPLLTPPPSPPSPCSPVAAGVQHAAHVAATPTPLVPSILRALSARFPLHLLILVLRLWWLLLSASSTLLSIVSSFSSTLPNPSRAACCPTADPPE